jgi:xanthine dehydrogenase small subunit
MRQEIRFLLGDEERCLTDVDPHTTVLNYLRNEEHLVGSKEGCAEGDCGACTVVIAEVDGDRLKYQALNSCIQFVPQLDGKQVLTVEHLRGADGALHPAQSAMAAAHGSQCGFCTPGFVMSLYVLYQNGGESNRDNINDALAGNLCRCTGYGPIVTAAQEMGGAPKQSAEEVATLSRLKSFKTGMVGLESAAGNYYAPTTKQELAVLYEAHPDAVLLAGGTDVGLWVTKQHRCFDTVISLGDVEDLKTIEDTGEAISIGAGASYTDAHELLGQHFPDFGEVIRRLGARQVRNAGTIGGNIANGSPIGDTPPILIALGSTLVLRKGGARREIALEDFFIDYGKQDLGKGEFVEAVKVPKLMGGAFLKAFKISKRFDQDISALLGAFVLELVDGKVTKARIAFGGMAATPKRAASCEKALLGKVWDQSTIAMAREALGQDFEPLTDMRATSDYRMQVAQNLLQKVYLESQLDVSVTRIISSALGGAHG